MSETTQRSSGSERLHSGASIIGQTSRIGERAIEAGLAMCGYLSIAITVGILFTLASETVGFFQQVSFAQYFGDTEWTPLFADKHFGIWPLIAGTMLTAGIAVSVALPFGLLAAVYLSEIASHRARSVLKPALEILAGVPTIVYGFFALVVVTPALHSRSRAVKQRERRAGASLRNSKRLGAPRRAPCPLRLPSV